MVQHNNY